MAKAKQQSDERSEIEREAEYLRESTDIFPGAIQDEFVRLSADLAHWNERYADAQRDYLRARAGEKQTRAAEYLSIRELASDMGQKLTEATVDAKVETSDAVVAAVHEHVEAEGTKARMYGVVDAIRAKKDMLVSLGATQRAEMGGDPSLRREARDHRQLGDD